MSCGLGFGSFAFAKGVVFECVGKSKCAKLGIAKAALPKKIKNVRRVKI